MKYSNDEITVNWKPDVCIHAAECVGNLPKVFKPDEKPWVHIDGASVKEIAATIDKCPSGALSYLLKDIKEENTPSDIFRIRIRENGPLLIQGELELEDAEGNVEKCTGKNTALCRCGASKNKPFCDGTHLETGFQG